MVGAGDGRRSHVRQRSPPLRWHWSSRKTSTVSDGIPSDP